MTEWSAKDIENLPLYLFFNFFTLLYLLVSKAKTVRSGGVVAEW